ncbi:MAG: hypothetical protein R3321_06305, partial [Nitrososphaeraceae archaeon]|nr:hypothetical protein [Nitrososphaeraceae archaeon]
MCGIFGIVSKQVDIGPYGYFALMALQHRGQEASGMVSFKEGLPKVPYYKLGKGLVTNVYSYNDSAYLS